MTSGMTKTILYSGPLSMFGAKAEIALREKGDNANRGLFDREVQSGIMLHAALPF